MNRSMFQLIQRQTIGSISPLNFQRSIDSHRIQSIELSKNKDCDTVHTSPINDLDVDITENRYLLSGSSDGSLAIHDLEEWRTDGGTARLFKVVGTVMAGNTSAHKRSIETVQWYPLDTGIFTSSGTDRVLKIWDANRLQTAEEYAFNGIVHCHHLSPIATKHNLIAVGTDSSVVKLVDPRAGSASHSLRGHKEGPVRSVHWSNRDEFILATGGVDNFAMLWDVRTAKGCLMKLQRMGGKKHSGYTRDTTHDGSVNGLSFTPDGLHLVTAGTDQKLYLWNAWTGKKSDTRFPSLSHIKKRSVKLCVTGTPSQGMVFVPTGSSITSFGLKAGGKAKHFYGHYNSVNCCVYHESGHQLLSGGNDHKILVWSYHGDQDYEVFWYNQREEVLQRQEREEAREVEEGGGSDSTTDTQQPPRVPPSLAHTVDTWSDNDEDEAPS